MSPGPPQRPEPTNDMPNPRPPSRTLHYWLARVLQDARKDADVATIAIAGRLGIRATSTIDRFEAGDSWPSRPDQYLAAYAELCDGPEDPRDYYDQALALWRAEGEPPIVEPEGPTARAEKVARRAAGKTPPQ